MCEPQLCRTPQTDNKQFIGEPEKLCWKRESHPAVIRGGREGVGEAEVEVKRGEKEKKWKERQSQR